MKFKITHIIYWNDMRHSIAVFILFLLSLPLLAQQHPHSVRESLEDAGAHRAGYERLLSDYAKSNEKYKMACFLIANMRYHQMLRVAPKYDSRIWTFIQQSDSLYHALIKDATDEAQEKAPIHPQIKALATHRSALFDSSSYAPATVEEDFATDAQIITPNFIRTQVEHAAQLRASSSFLKTLPLKQFCELVLSYRSIDDYPFVESSQNLWRVYAKYLRIDTAVSSMQLTERYKRMMWWLRRMQGKYPYDVSIGWPEMFFVGDLDCLDLSEYATQILRACGVPAVVEFNIAYKDWAARHFMVAILQPDKNWVTFSPESNVASMDKARFKHCLNIYRYTFEAQANTPVQIANGEEAVPIELSSPCIEDVSKRYLKTTSLVLDYPATSPSRKLVYLASFQRPQGIVPVTWGLVRKDRKCVFENVVKDNIYYPMYADEKGKLCAFANPFALVDDSTSVNGYTISEVSKGTGRMVEVNLERTYPRKSLSLQQAENTKGTLLLASDDAKFKTCDTLAMITETPLDAWNYLTLPSHRPYQYYRLQAPKTHPHVLLSEIQFLTASKYQYANATVVMDGDGSKEHDAWILDEPLEKCKWKAEYDGKVQTAPEAWPHVTLKLKKPQYVTAVRYVIKNGGNRIVPKHIYSLYVWGERGWERQWIKRADQSVFTALKLEVGRMYWLSDETEKKEEIPFVVQADGTTNYVHIPLFEKIK